MSSFILQKAPTDGSWFSEVSDVQIAKCGVLYCPDTDVKDNTNLDRPETIKVKHMINTRQNKIYSLTSFYEIIFCITYHSICKGGFIL